jgi:hypothetical protein
LARPIGGVLATSRCDSLSNVQCAEVSFGEQGIVNGTEHSQVLEARIAAACVGVLVVDLKERTRSAPASAVTHIRATEPVAICHFALNSMGDVLSMYTRPIEQGLQVDRSGMRLLARSQTSSCPRLVGLGEPLLLSLLDREVERTFEHHSDVPTRDGVAD